MRNSLLFLAAVLILAGFGADAIAQNGVVSLDNVTNQLSTTRLYAGSTHTVSIRYNFLGNPTSVLSSWYGSNGFEVYSPDGADWVSFTGNRGPLVNALPVNTSRYQKHFNYDGSNWIVTGNNGETPASGSTGASGRVGFYLATVGFQEPGGYEGGVDNGIALTFQFRSLLADEGKTICFDTCAAITAWEWSNGDEDFPVWDNGLGVDGPRCWEITRYLPGVNWCAPTGNVSFSYCNGGSYQLCAYGSESDPITYLFAPGYETGFGSLDPVSGLWTWSGPTVPQSAFVDIAFLACDPILCTYSPFILHVTVTEGNCDCCLGRAGDVNMSGEDEPTIADVSLLIDHLFISGAWLNCLEEADVNQSGGTAPTADDITIGDVSSLIDYLFITGPETGVLPVCL